MFVVTFAGQAPITGFSASLTVTRKLHELVSPAASVAVQVTVVVPLLNVEPDKGLHETVMAPQPPPVVGAEKLTARVHCPAAVVVVWFVGHVIVTVGQGSPTAK